MTTKLNTPWTYKNWLVWGNTMLENLSLSECVDTKKGICLKENSIEECIENSKNLGYYIEFKNSDKNICVPVTTKLYPKANPVYSLVNQNDHFDNNTSENVKISTFINVDKFPFPPLNNIIFYRDIVNLKDTENDNTVSTYINDFGIYIGKKYKKHNNIVILPYQVYYPDIEQYTPVKFGDLIKFSKLNTSYILKKNINYPNNLVWDITIGIMHGDDFAFKLLPENDNKKIGDVLNYNDNFKIQYINNSMLYVNEKYNMIEIHNTPQEKNSSFYFTSKMTGYYCDDGKCKPVSIDKLDNSGKYKNNNVYRKKNCLGLCNDDMVKQNIKSSNSDNSSKIYIIVYIFIIMIVVYIFIKLLF